MENELLSKQVMQLYSIKSNRRRNNKKKKTSRLSHLNYETAKKTISKFSFNSKWSAKWIHEILVDSKNSSEKNLNTKCCIFGFFFLSYLVLIIVILRAPTMF